MKIKEQKLFVSIWIPVLLVLALATSHGYSASSNWKPEKNVEIVTGSGPGGGLDRTARTIQKVWQDKNLLDVPITVVSKPGGTNALSWAYLNSHSGDGHYLSITSLSLLTNHITGSNPLRHSDITPIAQLFSEYISFAVRADSPIKTGKDLIDVLRKDLKSLSFGIAPGLGAAGHLGACIVLKSAGIDIKRLRNVVFNSGGTATTALLGGHVDIVPLSVQNFAPQVEAGKLRLIAIASPQRMEGSLANVPTWREQGIGAVFDTWRGVIGPKGLAPAQVAYWEDIFAKLAQTDEWKRDLKNNLWISSYMNSADSKKFLDAQYSELRALLTELEMAR